MRWLLARRVAAAVGMAEMEAAGTLADWWLLAQRAATAVSAAESGDSIPTVLFLGRGAKDHFVGRSASGHWTIGRPLHRPTRPALWEIQGIVDLLAYENRMGRPVAIIASPGPLADGSAECLAVSEGASCRRRSPLAARYAAALRRDGELRLRRRRRDGDPRLQRVVVHTTSLEALPGIVRARTLLSRSLLRERRRAHRSSSEELLKEPPDYADYVMFGSATVTAGEVVVNSHRLGHFYGERNDDDYVPGVRLFFDRRLLECHPGVTFDGLHPLKIQGRVDLGEALLAVAVADAALVSLCQRLGRALLFTGARTPSEYVTGTNDLVIRALQRC